MLRSIEHIPRNQWGSANIARWLPLRHGVTEAEVRAALTALADRHESLRTVYRLSPYSTPTQEVLRHPDLAIEVVDLADSGESAESVVASSRERAFGLENDLGWRATICARLGELSGVALTVHHIAADGWAQDLIATDLAPVLAAPCRFVPSMVADPVAGPGALAVEQRSRAWTAQRAETHDHHVDLLSRGLLTPPAKPRDGVPPRIDGELRLDHLAGPIADASRRMRVFPQGFMLAMTALLAGARFGGTTCPLWQMTSNRFNPRWNGLVSSLNQVVCTGLDLSSDSTLVEFTQRTQHDSTAALRYGCYDVDEFRRLAEGMIGAEPAYRNVFNWAVGPVAAGPVGVPIEDIPRATPTTGTSHRSAAGDCYFVFSDEPCLTLRYFCTCPNATEDSSAAMLRTFEELVRRTVTDPDQRIGWLLDRLSVPEVMTGR